MTKLQKQIQKTSSWVILAFYWLTLAPVSRICQHSMTMSQGSHYPLSYHLIGILLQLLVLTALILAQRIFRDMRIQYSPFNPIHVRRLRIIALLTFAVFFVNSILEVWIGMGSGHFAPMALFLTWLRLLNLAQLAIPVTVYAFSFILDNACKLQAEADTTL